MDMKSWPKLPFDIERVTLAPKWEDVLRHIEFSRHKVMVQNYYSGDIQHVDAGCINMLCHQMHDKDRHKTGRPNNIAPLNRHVRDPEEKMALARIWMALLQLEMTGKKLRSDANILDGNAKRAWHPEDGDEVSAAINDDPTILAKRDEALSMKNKAKRLVEQFQDSEAMARQIRNWLGEMIIPYRKQRDADLLKARHQEVLEEEALRETAREQARKANKKVLDEATAVKE